MGSPDWTECIIQYLSYQLGSYNFHSAVLTGFSGLYTFFLTCTDFQNFNLKNYIFLRSNFQNQSLKIHFKFAPDQIIFGRWLFQLTTKF